MIHASAIETVGGTPLLEFSRRSARPARWPHGVLWDRRRSRLERAYLAIERTRLGNL